MNEPFYKNSKSYLICGLIGLVGVIYLGLAIFINSVSTVIDIDERNTDGMSVYDSIVGALKDLKYGFKISRFFPLLLAIALFVVLIVMLYFVIKDNFLNENFHRLDKLASEEKPIPKGTVVSTVFGEEEDAVLSDVEGKMEASEKPAEISGETADKDSASDEKDEFEDKPFEIKEVTSEQKKAMARRRRLQMGGPIGVFFRFEDRHRYLARIIPGILVVLIYIGLYHTREYKEAYNATTELVSSWQSIITQYKMMNMETDMVAEIHTGFGLLMVIAGVIFYFGAFCFNFVLDTLNED
ncbi:MAG: hypothetical protein IJ065_11675 [Eubacterium sp.]|nr:hypothetical protein [Eubacterium sp.]